MSDDKTFYIAADYARKQEAAQLAADLEQVLGMTSMGRWYKSQPAYKDDGLGGELTGDDAAAAVKVAQEDWDDLASSDFFIQLTTGEKARGGRHVELGMAIALKHAYPYRQVIVVGPREHAFHYGEGIHHLTSQDELEIFLQGFLAGYAVD